MDPRALTRTARRPATGAIGDGRRQAEALIAHGAGMLASATQPLSDRARTARYGAEALPATVGRERDGADLARDAVRYARGVVTGARAVARRFEVGALEAVAAVVAHVHRALLRVFASVACAAQHDNVRRVEQQSGVSGRPRVAQVVDDQTLPAPALGAPAALAKTLTEPAPSPIQIPANAPRDRLGLAAAADAGAPPRAVTPHPMPHLVSCCRERSAAYGARALPDGERHGDEHVARVAPAPPPRPARARAETLTLGSWSIGLATRLARPVCHSV